ncbi:hypothetical protein F4811DRAFT_527830 [Daldinia bambusicola]|nr:hypothetical protein F4811DRAFT_527830 [Daldinia bambusicola]
MNSTLQPNCNFLGRRQFEGADRFGWKVESNGGSWCEYARCLRDWKIVPSKPRDSAYGLTPFDIWFYLNITAINVLLDLRNPYPPKKCKGPRFVDWLSVMHTVTTLVFWMVEWGSLARDNATASPISLVAWISTWKLAIGINFHPWSCWPPLQGRKTKRVASWSLNIMALLQWCATIYALRVHWDFYHIQANLRGQGHETYVINKYDCMQSEIESAPGRSVCSAEALCSKRGFFTSPEFNVDATSRYSTVAYTVLILYGIVIYPFTLVLFLLSRCFSGDDDEEVASRESLATKSKSGSSIASLHLFLLVIFSIAGLAYGIWMLVVGSLKWDFERLAIGDRGTITWNPNCTAVHVNVSPEWFYLDIDVDGYNRARRIAGLWFNV